MLVVTGSVRSGTTILQRILHRHPDIALTNELHSLLGLGEPTGVRYLRRVLRRGGRRRNRREVFRPEEGAGSRLANVASAARFAAGIAAGGPGRLTPARVERAYRALYPGARIVGDKSPSYVAHLGGLVEQGLSCVVVYRDCRDVVASALEAGQTIWRGMPHARHFDSAAKIARSWVGAIETMERYREQLCTVRYEDLVSRPGQELAAIARSLGVDEDGLPADLVRGSSVGRHKTSLAPADLAAVLELAGPTMARLGYV